MTSPDPLPAPAAGDDSHAPTEEELVPLRRSFPKPKRRNIEEVPLEVNEPEEIETRPGMKWAILAGVVAVAAAGVWLAIRPSGERAGAGPSADTPAATQLLPSQELTGPPDPARDTYFSATPIGNPPAPPTLESALAAIALTTAPTPAPAPAPKVVAPAPAPALQPAPPIADTPSPKPQDPAPAASPEPVVLGELESKYLAALERASAETQGKEATAWLAEIARVKAGKPLPPPDESQPPELQRLQSIYRRESEKAVGVANPVPADARRIELFFMADDTVALLLNGAPAATEYLAGAANEAGAVQKATLTLKPGDVLGFRCASVGGQRNFCLFARSGVLRLFATNERWEAAVEPPDTWWKGEGKTDVRPQILRGRVDYNAANAARFEKLANTHSSEYDVLWAGNADTAAFRYKIRSVDLPDKPATQP